MLYCDKCKKPLERQFTCGHCGGLFCYKHKSPKNHDCISITSRSVDSRKTKKPSKVKTVKKPSQVKTGGISSREDKPKRKLKPLDYLGIVMAVCLLLTLLSYFAGGQLWIVFGLIGGILFLPWVIGTLIQEAVEKESKTQRCTKCGKAEPILMHCNYCDLLFCLKHSSPEKHYCVKF